MNKHLLQFSMASLLCLTTACGTTEEPIKEDLVQENPVQEDSVQEDQTNQTETPTQNGDTNQKHHAGNDDSNQEEMYTKMEELS